MVPSLQDTTIATNSILLISTKPSDMAHSNSSTAEDDHTPLSETSWSEGVADSKEEDIYTQRHALHKVLSELFEENIFAKPYRSASRLLQGFDPSPNGFPEIVPQQGPMQGHWVIREPEFWTCGFFPGTLYALLERSIRYPGSMRDSSPGLRSSTITRSHLLPLCKSWSEPLHGMASRTDTHDIGFIIMPALRRDWELFGCERSLGSIRQAAHSLATRHVLAADVIRSWDCIVQKDMTVTDMENNLLIIIDSMCNLELLFYAAAHTGEQRLADVAASHATTLLKTHLRPENVRSTAKHGYHGQLYSTCHVANIDPKTGDLKWRRTHQGYAHDSTWSRGQAWAILGYAQTYNWTKEENFLDAACGCAEYFLHRLETSPSCVELPVQSGSGNKGTRRGRYVPLWDFDAPIENPQEPLRDSSAGVIAANGMLLLSQALAGLGRHTLSRHFLDASIEIVKDTLDVCLATEKVKVTTSEDGGKSIKAENAVLGATFDAILKHGTVNNYGKAIRRYANHGLVYGDYYLVEFGNLLLSMGLV
ncbi:glucuronyl hydrolase [Fusarium denticulatum]|uniref:Glucuronyl hydrolase n=1 Tax=Fusarium denticulatum TaxID=48507 RepID=A0A8H5X2B4_9HYPO|nr:glucuronyl hydrolase [Fusarium denticulatum]